MKFSETEQKIIRKIVNYDWSSLSTLDNFIGKELHFDLIIQPSNNLYWLYYSVNRGLDGKQERLLDFFNLYFLIKRLLKNDLLIIASGVNLDRFVGSQKIEKLPGKYGVFKDGSYIDVDGKWKDKNNIIIKDFIPFPEKKTAIWRNDLWFSLNQSRIERFGK